MAQAQTIQRAVRWTIIPLSIMACIVAAVVHVNRSVRAGQTTPVSARNITLGMGRPGSLYAVTLWVKNPAQVQGNDSVHVTVNDAKGEVESKWLHAESWVRRLKRPQFLCKLVILHGFEKHT